MNETLTITAGNTTNSFNIASIQDDTDEGNETFTVTLSNPENVTLATSTVTGTITNDDPDPAVTLTNTDDEIPATSATLSRSGVTDDKVSENSRADVVVNVTLDGPARTESVPLSIHIEGNTALPSDFQFEDSTQSPSLDIPLTIPALSTTSHITVPMRFLSDNIDEPDETIEINGSGAGLDIDPIFLLVARVKGALRRQALPIPFVVGELQIDYDQRNVLVGEQNVDLTATEYELLRVLSMNAGRVMSYAALLRQVWGKRIQSSDDPKAVRAVVKRLRNKRGDNASEPTYVCNERGVG